MFASEDRAHAHASHRPDLTRVLRDGVTVHTDEELRAKHGIVVAFSERTGGVSRAPYADLNLAAHVGDDPVAVDANRHRLLASLGMALRADRLVTAEQVHGERVGVIDEAAAGSGAHVSAAGAQPVPGTDALITTTSGIPLLMCFADCVPIVLVALTPVSGIAVVHAGWRGALASLPGSAVAELANHAGCEPSDVIAYVGPHIGACCYEVDEALVSHFGNKFDTIGAVRGRLDLAAAVRESLARAGVPSSSIAELGECTREHTDRYFSYRAAQQTGRHGALAAITEGE